MEKQINKFTQDNNSIYYKNQRITFLTDSLVRLEYSPTKDFVDDPSQMVINRDFESVEVSLVENDGYLELYTPKLLVETNGEAFSRVGLKITLRQTEFIYRNTYFYGDKIDTLKGTSRTLDEADGEIELEDGILSKMGFSIIDDSSSMLYIDDFFKPRDKAHKDIYFFGYNHRYLECLSDYYKLTGKQPMIPRFALGNWWSRYFKYTTNSYLELMDRFKKEDIPFSVAVIDMDWHLVDIDKKYGSGWTGYTWNKDLFPDPKAFISELHDRALTVTLNDHPADGVRAYENNYDKISKELGVIENKPVLFDASNKKYIDSLQTIILEPLENDGVDFWWIDWQQGNTSRIEGLDPLWILNFFRFEANKKNNKRPLIFSRYSGPGSHRYPIGFSGDTIISWDSLKFQPKFTACASNIGYGWWSHDIGGHMRGIKDNELMARWIQFGVFSPIMRLHSSNEFFNGKEPWRYSNSTYNVMRNFLSLRNKLIPYLYTMNYLAHNNDVPLIRPMYFYHSEEEDAYNNENQYYFGSSMIVSPIVSKYINKLLMAETQVWLPQGFYYDFFTNRRYKGNRNIKMYRPLESIPVLIKEGNIIPLCNEINHKKNPSSLYLKVFMGNNGKFTLYEDDNVSEDYKKDKKVITNFINNYHNNEFIIEESRGDLSLIPNQRDYEIEFIGIDDTQVKAYVDDLSIVIEKEFDDQNKILKVKLSDINCKSQVKIVFDNNILAEINKLNSYIEILERSEIEIILKGRILEILKDLDSNVVISNLISLNLNPELYNALLEILLA